MAPGHDFKKDEGYSIGQLRHPEIHRFHLKSPFLFKPPLPGKTPYDEPHKKNNEQLNVEEFFKSNVGCIRRFIEKPSRNKMP